MRRLARDVAKVADCSMCEFISELIDNCETADEIVSIAYSITETLLEREFDVELEYIDEEGNKLGSDTFGLLSTSGIYLAMPS